MPAAMASSAPSEGAAAVVTVSAELAPAGAAVLVAGSAAPEGAAGAALPGLATASSVVPAGGTTSAATKPVVYTETDVISANVSVVGVKPLRASEASTPASRESCSGVEIGWVISKMTVLG